MAFDSNEPLIRFEPESDYCDSYVLLSDGDDQDVFHLYANDAIRIAKQILQHYGVITTTE